MPHTAIGKEQIYYEIDGKGPPLVLIPGYNCDLSLWEGVRGELAKHFQLVLFDNRGIGRSSVPKESFTIEKMAEDVVHLIEALKLQRPAILGHSMGGAIAQVIAHRFQEKVGKTIFAQTFIQLRPAACAALFGQLHLLEDGVPMERIAEQVIPWLFADNKVANKEFTELFTQLQVDNPNPATKEGLKKQCEALFAFNSEKWVSEIKTAPLILSGDEDILCPLKDAEIMASKIPGAKLHVLKKVGHVSPAEMPSEFIEAVRRFLR